MKIRRKQFEPEIIDNNAVLSSIARHNGRLGILLLACMVFSGIGHKQPARTQVVPGYVLPDDTYTQDIYNLAQSSAVRIIQENTAGTGVIIYREGQIYTALTNWHVVAPDRLFRVMTADGKTYPLLGSPQQLGDLDLAIIRFQSPNSHQVATVATEDPEVGEKVYAAGFPLYERDDSNTNTISLGIRAFRLTQGEVSLIPPKSLPNGYHLGYTNDTKIGMSGGPIFNTKGFLVGVHGRGKHRDPGFGVYTFEDGSEPSPEMLETMINSSWGIPISTYLRFASQTSQN